MPAERHRPEAAKPPMMRSLRVAELAGSVIPEMNAPVICLVRVLSGGMRAARDARSATVDSQAAPGETP